MMMMMIIIIITKTMMIMIIIQVLAHLVTVRYSPPSWRPLHWLSLVAAATGVALLLLSRGHYSIGQLILIMLVMVLFYWSVVQTLIIPVSSLLPVLAFAHC